ncbi:hypothetical protein N7478_007413 [Penicillium angulare]|uniref:uncharacterized protein n=1 Tax=Penicillium angulare TaxID=116970 RepID=UPI0025425A78|nr:uncharacterized protein N7478_007413 [Penicillium angulare]KAJ5272288.1 hypothetical protein N7478_007413 [Penicillium angulare]
MSASPASAGKQDKGAMSSRLMTMKFMQRAAATSASKETELPGSSPASKGKDHSPKRQRMSMENTGQSDLERMQAAMAAEEEKRRVAVARQAAEAGESQWVLNIPAATPRAQPYVMAAESLDAEDDLHGGRRGFGNFKRKQNTSAQTNNGSDDDEEGANGSARSRHGQGSRGPRLKDLTSISGGGGRGQSMGAPSQKKKKRKSGQGH